MNKLPEECTPLLEGGIASLSLTLTPEQEPSIAAHVVTLLRGTCPAVHVLLAIAVTNPNQVVRAQQYLRTCLTALALKKGESFTLVHHDQPPAHLFAITRQSAK